MLQNRLKNFGSLEILDICNSLLKTIQMTLINLTKNLNKKLFNAARKDHNKLSKPKEDKEKIIKWIGK
jgi:hypothetical protein